MSKRLGLFVLILLMALINLLPGLTIQAQEGDSVYFMTYQCTLDMGRNAAEIRAVLVDARGRRLPDSGYTVAVAGTGDVIPAGTLSTPISVDSSGRRPPLHMIIALDITTTMPIKQLEEAILDGLVPGLASEDRVALIAFAEEIFPRTAFYTDKGALANDHIRDLLTLEGDNRLYAAILESVNSFPQEVAGRKVVLVLTDSGRRDSDSTRVEDIINDAARLDVQVFAVGLVTRDHLAVEDLSAVTENAGGRLWVYAMAADAPVPFNDAVSGFLEELVDSLEGEIVIRTDLPDLPLDEAGVARLDVTVTLNTGITLSDTVNCPFEQLHHDIRFVNAPTDAVVRDTYDIELAVTTDLDYEQVRVRLLDYDEELDIVPVPDSGLVTYTLGATQLPAGEHRISAQLVNLTLRELTATPETLSLNTQRSLVLRYLPPGFEESTGVAQLEVVGEGFSEVQFTIAPAADPEREVYYGLPVALDEQGRAALSLPEIQAQVAGLFPEMADGERYLLGAVVPGIGGSRIPLAVADPVIVALTPPLVTEAPEPPGEPFRLPNIEGVVPLAIIALLLVFINMLLRRRVRWSIIQRMIKYPDNTPMSPQMMTVTVHRDGLKQSHTLTKRTVTIGRGPSNDINLGGDSSISRQHGVVMWRRSHWYFSFRKSPATARINGRRRRGAVLARLKPVTEIEISRTLLIFHSNAQQDISDFIKTEF